MMAQALVVSLIVYQQQKQFETAFIQIWKKIKFKLFFSFSNRNVTGMPLYGVKRVYVSHKIIPKLYTSASATIEKKKEI